MSNRIKQSQDTSPEDEPVQEELEFAEDEEVMEEAAEEQPQVKEEAAPVKERAGAILKREREKQGISLDIVHEATKIPMDALRAIEENYKVRMLSPFYYSGFVRMYAKFLDLDASEILDDYKPEELPEHVDVQVEDEFEIPKWVNQLFTRERMQMVVIGIGLLLALYVFVQILGFLFSREPKPKAAKETVKVEAAKPEIKKPLVQTAQATRQEAPKIETPKEAPKVIAPVVVPEPVPKPKPKPQPTVAAPLASVSTPSVAEKNVNLTVRANQNSWLRVKTDGKIVFQSTLRKGAVEKWVADKEIDISGRNINQLEFELNGKMIGTLGRKNRNAKKVVVTKSGLSVKQ